MNNTTNKKSRFTRPTPYKDKIMAAVEVYESFEGLSDYRKKTYTDINAKKQNEILNKLWESPSVQNHIRFHINKKFCWAYLEEYKPVLDNMNKTDLYTAAYLALDSALTLFQQEKNDNDESISESESYSCTCQKAFEKYYFRFLEGAVCGEICEQAKIFYPKLTEYYQSMYIQVSKSKVSLADSNETIKAAYNATYHQCIPTKTINKLRDIYSCHKPYTDNNVKRTQIISVEEGSESEEEISTTEVGFSVLKLINQDLEGKSEKEKRAFSDYLTCRANNRSALVKASFLEMEHSEEEYKLACEILKHVRSLAKKQRRERFLIKHPELKGLKVKELKKFMAA